MISNLSKLVTVVKIGGNVIDDIRALKAFMNEFAALPGPKILVHGGGKEATRLSKTLGIETTMIDGRRVTDAETLDVCTMVYAGLVNKRIVAGLQAIGVDATGLTGADGNLIPATRRPANPVDYGFVGDIDPAQVNVKFLESLLESGKVPVLCALCHDGRGTMLNCNADTIASSVARAVSKVATTRLVYCFEMPGVLEDVNDRDSIIELITPDIFEDLKSRGIVAKGMLPKLQNALDSAKAGVSEVRICQAGNLNNSVGTTITIGDER